MEDGKSNKISNERVVIESYREEPRRMDCHPAQFFKTQTSTLHKYEANLPLENLGATLSWPKMLHNIR